MLGKAASATRGGTRGIRCKMRVYELPMAYLLPIKHIVQVGIL